MDLKKKLPIKRQKSLHAYIHCKSILDLKLNPGVNKCPIVHKKSLDLPFHTNDIQENPEKNRKSSFQSKIKLKPIIKERNEPENKITTSPLLSKSNKLKQKIRHSSKSGVSLPFYLRCKFPKEKIFCVNKERKNISDKHISLNMDLKYEEEKNKLFEIPMSIDILYKSEKSISATQKGFLIKNNAEKQFNQDSSLIIEDVCGIKKYNIYSIMDGHGSNGHFVSNFIKEKIIQYFTDISFYFNKIKPKEKTPLIYPDNILDLISKKLKKNDYQKIKDFYKEVDESLSSNEVLFDSNFSGSTCIIIFQLGKEIICSNVGDSRALLIKENKDIVELSHDQKPEDENEKKRIESMGGIVSQCNDLYDDGKEGGPFRIWMKGCDYPGIAMSRSIGDKIAHSIGVINEPEILSFNLDEKSKYIILGSDGVWQYLNNEEILDIIFEEKDGEKICKDIINQAKNKFIENDEYVIDDITISLVFIE